MALVKELAYWINERERMRARKEMAYRLGNSPAAKFGWSDDPHMGTVRYCNVHRENDKVTRWMRQNWTTKDSPVWWFVLGRMLNYIPTLEDIVEFGIGGEGRGPDVLPELDGLAEGLKARRESGEKVFTSAYTISTCGQRMDKIDYVIGVISVCEVAQAMPMLGDDDELISWPRYSSLADCWEDLARIKGLGSFLAAQVVADLKNTAGHPVQTAQDRVTWCAPGPGSLRGLQAFWGAPVTPSQFHERIAKCYEMVKDHIDPAIDTIDMQDFQNCLCEFSKYMKIKEGRGHARNNYRPGRD